jgi:cyclopropane fatty-acyl-phospholipid synthase-like methyltransferase
MNEKNDLRQSIIESLDGAANPEIYPYLPYILQDSSEMGTDPRAVADLVKKHIKTKPFAALDLGCGKGAVAIRLAEMFDCHVTGIDGLPEFITDAQNFAKKQNVAHKCTFELNDARVRITTLQGFDLAILGAVGQLFGNMHQTLTLVGKTLKPGGHIIIDDGWIPDDSIAGYDRCLKKSEFYHQIETAGFEILEEKPFETNLINTANDEIWDAMKKRIDQLIEKEPQKRSVFEQYLEAQQHEIKMMATEIVCALWVLKMK